MSGPSKFMFISYYQEDEKWAQWIAWHLDQAGYMPKLAWSQPDQDAITNQEWQNDMAKAADYVIAVCSQQYIDTFKNQPGLLVTLNDPSFKEEKKILSFTIEPLELIIPFDDFDFISLFGKDESTARELLLTAVSHKRPEPLLPALFPGGIHLPISVPPPSFPDALPTIWTVPRRNQAFTGRRQILTDIYNKFKADPVEPILVLYGLCGIGKTEIAREYAYRHKKDYRAVLWINAGSANVLHKSITDLPLDFPEPKDLEESGCMLNHWLAANANWLLIFDHVHDLEPIINMLPQNLKGHVLLTTRTQIISHFDVAGIPVEIMSPEEGALLLLRRSRKIAFRAPLYKAADEDRSFAIQLSHLLGGLPLALDQAAAYIVDNRCTIEGYLKRYNEHPFDLLNIRGDGQPEHPESAAVTILKNFQQIEQMDAAAAELLRFCTFLHYQNILEAIILQGATELGLILKPFVQDTYQLDKPIKVLRKFSMIHRHSDQELLVIHPLVQIVLQHTMHEIVHRWWSERTIRAMRRTFPDPITISQFPTTFSKCQEYRPHLHKCIDHIKRWQLTFADAEDILRFMIILLWHDWLH